MAYPDFSAADDVWLCEWVDQDKHWFGDRGLSVDDASAAARIDQMESKVYGVTLGSYTTYGAEGHGFRLNPPLAERQVAEFENRHGIQLPPDYRAFITRVADG